jgi:hypothetical protein
MTILACISRISAAISTQSHTAHALWQRGSLYGHKSAGFHRKRLLDRRLGSGSPASVTACMQRPAQPSGRNARTASGKKHPRHHGPGNFCPQAYATRLGAVAPPLLMKLLGNLLHRFLRCQKLIFKPAETGCTAFGKHCRKKAVAARRAMARVKVGDNIRSERGGCPLQSFRIPHDRYACRRSLPGSSRRAEIPKNVLKRVDNPGVAAPQATPPSRTGADAQRRSV